VAGSVPLNEVFNDLGVAQARGNRLAVEVVAVVTMAAADHFDGLTMSHRGIQFRFHPQLICLVLQPKANSAAPPLCLYFDYLTFDCHNQRSPSFAGIHSNSAAISDIDASFIAAQTG
jgi:hypothetical protein